MYVQKTCGGCGASIEMDTGMIDTPEVFTYIQLEGARFNEAHIGCGFVAPLKIDKPETVKLYSIEHTHHRKEKE